MICPVIILLFNWDHLKKKTCLVTRPELCLSSELQQCTFFGILQVLKIAMPGVLSYSSHWKPKSLPESSNMPKK